MDADTLRMMADLGLHRRDYGSAPLADTKGRVVRDDSCQQQAILADFEARRTKVLSDIEPGDEQRLKLRAWNTETNFERDEVNGQLGNRFSGQGHRAALSARHQYDERWEAAEARFGEERRLYLQERQVNGSSNYVPSGKANGPNAVRGHVFGSSAPRSFSGGHKSPSKRGRVSSDAPNHARAPSPRAAGTVRFRSSHRSVQTAQDSRTANVPAASTKALSAAAINGRAASTDSFQDHIQIIMRRNLALHYAANPGPEYDRYLQERPDQADLLMRARAKFIKDATRLAADPSGHECDVYLQTHKDRQWMLEAAVKAKELVEHHNEGEITKYYNGHSEHADFLGAARKAFTLHTNTAAVLDGHHANGVVDGRAEGESQSVAAVAASNVMSSTPASSRVAMVNGHVTRESAHDAAHSETTTVVEQSPPSTSGSDLSVETAISTPYPDARGTLTATFFNFAGELLVHKQMTVDAPVHVTMNMHSRAARYDPCELIPRIEAMAKTMQDLTNGLDGVRLSEDGLWEEV